ncbi:hypothetical protein PSPO01_01403, partial [Paraphaeosphaeria sporulosa]
LATSPHKFPDTLASSSVVNPSTLLFNVEGATEADIGEILSIIFKCYDGKNEYINVVFPQALTEEGYKLNVARMLFINSIAPNDFWEKVVESETGETTIAVSNDNGLRLYEKFGLMAKSERNVTLLEEFGRERGVKIWTMIRDRQSR